jgi:hypothetical protein
MEMTMLNLLGCILYLTWLLLPLALAVYAKGRKHERLVVLSSILGFFSIPALCLLPVFWIGWSEPADLLMYTKRHAVDLPGYRVEFVQDPGFIEFNTYFRITRTDGKQAQYSIDGDANSCRNLTTKQVAQRIYFLCSGEDLSRASYIDIQRRTVYSGWYQTEQALSGLAFK